MNQPNRYPNWFLNIWERGFQIVLFGLIAMASFVAIAIYFDYRLGAVEQRLSYRPPESYQPPDLKALAANGADESSLTQHEVVYVPIYSHVYHQGGSPFLLEATLSIRNVDPQQPVFIRSVKYFDTDGKPTKTHVEQLIRLEPLQTIEFLVEQHDVSGGSGANFLVEWKALENANAPLIEAVMVGNLGTQAISFVSRGVTVE